MVTLETRDRNQLLSILNSIPVLLSYRGRIQIIRNSGLEELLPRMQLESEPRLAIAEIVDKLANYGRTTHERETLGQFLNAIKQEIGEGELNALRFIDHLLVKYQMMTPIAISSEFVNWRTGPDEDDILEKVIGENTLRPIAFLRKGLEVARAVAFVLVPGVRSGTGFLLAPNLLITNHHVLPETDDVQRAVFRFNYQDDIAGHPEPYFDYHVVAAGQLHFNKELDYTIVELENSPGEEWGSLPLEEYGVKHGERVSIIQHPAGMPKQVSFQNNFVHYVDDQVVQYVTTTLPGSSGAPVLNDQWRVVALHHAGGLLPEPRTGLRYFRNEGINVTKILADLPLSILRHLGE